MNTPLRSSEHVVVVGASAAGLTAAEALRHRGHEGPITLVGDEAHAPYDRPPLSKQLLTGAATVDSVALREDAHLTGLDIDQRRGVAALALDVNARSVVLSDETTISYDRVVIATGVRARVLPGSAGIAGVHTLRTIDDAVALRRELRPGRRVIVVGGGFVGTEVAAVAVDAGCEVTLTSPAPTLLENVLGHGLGVQITALHARHGVQVRTGESARVTRLTTAEGHVDGVVLASGERLGADVVVVGIGSAPATEWLRTSGLSLRDGVECAADCSAVPGVYAAGDVARWHNPLFGLSMRIEHRTNAVDQALHVADRLLHGDAAPYAPVPYFWSDQYDVKVQAHGVLRDHDEVLVVEGSIEEKRLIALYRRDDRLVGVLGIGAARALRGWRQQVAQKLSWRDALDNC